MIRGAAPRSRPSFVIDARAAGPPAHVFALLADAPGWQEWAGPCVPRARWETGPPGRVGAVRRLGAGPLSVREKVVVHQPPTAYAYVLLTGARWHGYRADVHLTEGDGGGTHVRWSGQLCSPVPCLPGLLLPVFRLLVQGFAARLVQEADRRWSSGG